MCVCFLGFQHSKKIILAIALNRDEFYKRPSQPALFWDEDPKILSGKDKKADGTWFGITKDGKFSLIINYREPKSIRKNATSRGKLVENFLKNNISAREYTGELERNYASFNLYNLIFGSYKKIFYFSTKLKQSTELKPGFYGLSNHLLNTPWPKVKLGNKKFKSISWDDYEDKTKIKEAMFSILQDQSKPLDSELPRTGF